MYEEIYLISNRYMQIRFIFPTLSYTFHDFVIQLI